MPGAPEAIAELARIAIAGGTRRLVLLSGRGEEEAERAEQELIASGADWTIVRCSWFSQNFSEDYLRDPVLAGELALPVGDVPEPFVDADDIADVAVAALTDDRHVGELYELTGPRLLTFADAAGEIGAASGPRRPLRAGLRAGVRERARRPRRAARTSISLLRYLFSRRARRPQREPRRRRPARARPPAARLPRLRRAGRGGAGPGDERARTARHRARVRRSPAAPLFAFVGAAAAARRGRLA